MIILVGQKITKDSLTSLILENMPSAGEEFELCVKNNLAKKTKKLKYLSIGDMAGKSVSTRTAMV